MAVLTGIGGGAPLLILIVENDGSRCGGFMRSREKVLANWVGAPGLRRNVTPSTWWRVSRVIGLAIVWFVLAALTVWAAAALYIDLRNPALRIPVTVIYVLAILAALFMFKRYPWAPVICLAGFCSVLVWWLAL